jgi:DNA-binding XRE family transcriptional regulator
MMSDLQQYVSQRTARDPEFAAGFEEGYADFKLGVLLRQARESAGLTQEDMAQRLRTNRSIVSQIENNAEHARLSMLRQYAEVLGKHLHIRLA